MKVKKAAFSVFFFLSMTAWAWAGGSVTQESRSINNDVMVHTFNWIGDSVSGIVPNTASNKEIKGWVFQVKTIPGSPAPLANYDIKLTDSDGMDISGDELQNRSATDAEVIKPAVGSDYNEIFCESGVTLEVSGTTVQSAQGGVEVWYYQYRHFR